MWYILCEINESNNKRTNNCQNYLISITSWNFVVNVLPLDFLFTGQKLHWRCLKTILQDRLQDNILKFFSECSAVGFFVNWPKAIQAVPNSILQDRLQELKNLNKKLLESSWKRSQEESGKRKRDSQYLSIYLFIDL